MLRFSHSTFDRNDDGRFGRMAVPEWADGTEVRCECADCGAHLLAAPGVHGDLFGICLVCGCERFSPVS